MPVKHEKSLLILERNPRIFPDDAENIHDMIALGYTEEQVLSKALVAASTQRTPAQYDADKAAENERSL